MTEHLFKIANAFQAAKEDGDNNSVNLRRLARNLSDFSKDMEEAVTHGTHDEANVRQRAVLAALLTNPRVREELAEQPAVAPLLKTVPVMQDCTLSMVVRPLNCQSAVLPVLAHLPFHLLSYLIKMELECITKAVSPPLFSFVVELSKAWLHGYRSCKCTDEAEDILHLFISVYRIAVQNLESNVPKNAASTFMLLLESLYQFSRFMLNDKPDELPISHVPELENSFLEKELKNVKKFRTSVRDTTVSLLELCQESVHKIDVNTWISWAEVEPTHTLFCSKISLANTQSKLTIQSLISYRAFTFLNLFSFESMDRPLDESPFITNEGNKALQSDLMQHPGLLSFLKQVASDPDYDPDSELGFLEVVSSLQSMTSETNASKPFLQNNVQTSTLTKDRLQKLTKRLLQEFDSESLFSCAAAADVLNCLAHTLTVQQAGQLLQRFLQHITIGDSLMAWNKCVLSVSRLLPGTEVRSAVLAELHRDGGDGCCRDWLSTDGYYPNLTSLCNTMALDQETNDQSLLSEGGLWWVSVQRPRYTVSALVQQAVSVSGMALVTARAVRQLAPLCAAHSANGRLSILSEALEPFITDMRTFSKPKHRIAFTDFFGSLCENNYSSSLEEDEEVVLVEEVMRELLLPTLQWRGSSDLDSLEVPLTLLQLMFQHRKEEVMRCCLPGTDTVSLMLTLLSIVHNCHCLLTASPNNSLHRAPTSDLDSRSSVNDECCGPAVAAHDHSNSIQCPTKDLDQSSSLGSNSHSPSPEVTSSPGSSQCLTVLCRSRDVLRRLVNEVANSEDHRQSAVLLRRCLNGSCLTLSVSCAGLLHPLLQDLVESSCTESVSDASLTWTSLAKVCSSRAAVVLRLMTTVSTMRAETDSTLESDTLILRLEGAGDWPYEQWVITLVQVLHSAPQEDWIAASIVLEKLDLKSPAVSGSPVSALAVLRDVLQLVTHAAEAGLPLNTALCYKHCTAAATYIVKQRCSALSWREQLSLVTRVFLWWCTDYVTAQDPDLPSLLLLRLADIAREIAAVVSTSDQPRRAPADLDKKTAIKAEGGVDRNTKMYSENSTVSCEELLGRRNSGHGNGAVSMPKNGPALISCASANTNSFSQGFEKNDPNPKLHNTVSLIEFRAMMGCLVEPFLKYSSGGKLSQTIATRLSTLLEC